MVVKAGLGKSKTLSPTTKITRAKRAKGMAQAVGCLPSKCKALSSHHSTAKKKKASERQEKHKMN
jgi:hypothetical protein